MAGEEHLSKGQEGTSRSEALHLQNDIVLSSYSGQMRAVNAADISNLEFTEFGCS